MFSLIITIISISLITVMAATFIFYSSKHLDKNNQIISKNKTALKTNSINESVHIPKIVKTETLTEIKHVNVFDFKNTENLFIPLISIFIFFILFKKYSNIISSFKLYINIIKTKKIIKNLNKSSENDLLSFINDSEIQLLKNKILLSDIKKSSDLFVYNELLNSKHDSIINNFKQVNSIN